MRVFVACLLIIGLGVLMIIGLFRLVRDLLSKSQFAAPSESRINDETVAEGAVAVTRPLCSRAPGLSLATSIPPPEPQSEYRSKKDRRA
jgi:hypothetical protein